MKYSEVGRHFSIADRITALSRVGAALMSELDEARLLHLIAETVRELTGAMFVAFTLQPVNEEGQPLGPSEGNLFHLAAVVGVTPQQEALFRRMPLGGEGLLAPIFRHGVPVLVHDVLTLMRRPEEPSTLHTSDPQDMARQIASAYAQGQLSGQELHSLGIPHGHPEVRSFLGAPLLDRGGQVRGGLLLGHSAPDQFTQEDEALLVGLAAQAAVALENARLYRALQRRAQEVNRIFETIADGVTLVDQHGAILRENGSARRLREQLEGTPTGERLAEALLHGPARRALRGEVVPDSSVRLEEGPDGLREYLVTVSPLHPLQAPSGPLKLDDGAMHPSQDDVSGVVVVWHDVTERRIREAEREARAQASKLEAIIEAMTDGLFVYDNEKRIVQMNTAGQLLVARSLPSDYATQPFQERFAQLVVYDEHDEPFPRKREPISRILQGEVLTPARAVDVVLRLHHASSLHLTLTGGPLHDADGHISGAVIIAHDVTERRRLEEIARRLHAETEARLSLLQLILDQLPSSVYLVRGHDARLVLANRAAATVWGTPWPLGQPLNEFLQEQGICIFGMDGHPLASEQLATLRALQYGETVRHHQEVIRHLDGTTLPVLVHAVPLNARDLNVLPSQAGAQPIERWEPAALVVHQDVTALKEAERLKDEFLSIAAHELRNPLAVLKGYAQMLLVQTERGKGAALAEWQLEALQEMDLATLRLDELTEDLLDVTRLQAGRLVLHAEAADLVALARRAVTRLQMTTERHSLSLYTPVSHLVAHVDTRRMEQVLSNLISNAIKYSPQGGPITVSIRKEVGVQMALLSVRDSGIGIPAHQQARIFGRFVRAENAQAHGIGGTGLGLYLSRNLVELHGGHLWFGSAEGQGSTFFITLPVIPHMNEP